jgi:glutathione synthase/RimK-type ligase-like ATP-grasp enzyme
MNIALVTSADIPNGIDDDRALFAELTRQGHFVRWQIWNDPLADWRFYQKVVIRSTWDYHYHIDDFMKWVARVSNESQLLNSKEIFIWNFDKSYLKQLAASGVSVVESEVFTSASEAVGYSKKLLQRNSKIIIKPTVSASADLTFLVTSPHAAEAAVQKVICKSGVLIQPLIESIYTDGEVSLVFFGGKYSHALRKFALGDFRIQAQFGGQVAAFEPSIALIRFAEQALAAVPAETAYARVDILDWKTAPKIGELELIEPELFFRMNPGRVQDFSEIISK